MSVKTARHAVLHFLSQVAFSIAGFASTFAIARVLGSDGVGVYALGLSLLVFINLPISGFGDAMIKRMSEGSEQNQFFTSGLLVNLLLSVIAAVLLLTFRGTLNDYAGGEVAILVVGVALSRVPFQSIKWALQGKGRVGDSGWLRTVERSLRTILQVGLLVLGLKIAGLFFGYIGSLVVTVAGFLLISDLEFELPEKRHFRELYAYAKYGWSGAVRGTTYNWMDTVVLGIFVSSSLVGVYEVAWTLSSFLLVASSSLSSAIFPEVSRLKEEGKTEMIGDYLHTSLVFSGIVLIPGFFGATVIGEDILKIYSTDFVIGRDVLLILILALTATAYLSQIMSVIRGLDRPDLALRIDAVFAMTNIVLNVVLVYLYGWYGAAFATLLSSIAALVAGYYAVTMLLERPRIPYLEIGKELLASLVMFGVVLVLDGWLSLGHYGTVLLVLVGGAVYASVLLAISATIRKKVLNMVPDSVGSTLAL